MEEQYRDYIWDETEHTIIVQVLGTRVLPFYLKVTLCNSITNEEYVNVLTSIVDFSKQHHHMVFHVLFHYSNCPLSSTFMLPLKKLLKLCVNLGRISIVHNNFIVWEWIWNRHSKRIKIYKNDVRALEFLGDFHNAGVPIPTTSLTLRRNTL